VEMEVVRCLVLVKALMMFGHSPKCALVTCMFASFFISSLTEYGEKSEQRKYD
jgi:hypothetical protein